MSSRECLASSKLYGCNDDDESVRPSCSRAEAITDSVRRRSTKNPRSSFRQLCEPGEEGGGVRGSEKELGDKECELACRGSAADPDPLSRKSSEGLRWLSRLEDEESQIARSVRELGDDGEKSAGNESEKEPKIEQSASKESEKESVQEDIIEPMTTASVAAVMSAEPEEPVRVRSVSLPSAPSSLVSRQCLVAVCFSTCMLLFLGILALITAYYRWVATPTLTTHTSDGNSGNHREQLGVIDDTSGCDSLFSFSRCANSDMFG